MWFFGENGFLKLEGLPDLPIYVETLLFMIYFTRRSVLHVTFI